MRDWDLFLKLQSELPADQLIPSPDPWEPPDGVGTLFIGPGGVVELINMWPDVPQPISVLTASGPEAEAIRAGLPEVRVVTGDMHDMPFASAEFAMVVSSQVLEHAFAPYIALLHTRRVLGAHGRARFVLPSFPGAEGGVGPFHLHCLDEPTWRELLRKTGFEVSSFHIQHGEIDPSVQYQHYHCETRIPPRPHNIILHRLVEARR
jgi:SAM-dependent methyltransferase